MADLEQIKRRALAAREFSMQIGAATFQLRLPTRHEAQLEALRTLEGAGDAAGYAHMARALLVRGVVGWSGVTVGDVLVDADPAAEPLPYSEDAVELVLDANPAWEDALKAEFMVRYGERNDRFEAAEKN